MSRFLLIIPLHKILTYIQEEMFWLKEMIYQKKPFCFFHLESLRISKRPLPKILWDSLDLHNRISQTKFLCNKSYNSDFHDGFIVKIHSQKVHLSKPIFSWIEKSFHCGEFWDEAFPLLLHNQKYFMRHMFSWNPCAETKEIHNKDQR